MKSAWLFAILATVSMGCSGSEDAENEASSGGASGGASGGSGAVSNPVPLPEGSREISDVVNLVDAAATQQLEQFIVDESPLLVVLRQGLTKPVNLFLESYLEEYDFVFFFTDHPIEGTAVAGKFEAVNQPASVGGGSEIEIEAGGYKSNGRLKGAIGIPYVTGMFPPLAHEVLHYWANFLDTRLGFGTGLDSNYGPHWGMSSVNGQLGGFDPLTLQCQTPAGSVPPNCTPLASGRYQYKTGVFAPNTNSFRDAPYSPLELYLMGLALPSEVPESFKLLDDATVVGGDDVSVIVEASGITSLPFTDITARHGSVVPLTESERQFSAAFVVVSASPASDAVLAEVATWAAAFGGRDTTRVGNSFATNTTDRATLTTTLGSRRDSSNPPPVERTRFSCDALQQDCRSPELGCYLMPTAVCALSGRVALDEPCDAMFACAPGLDCIAGADSTAYVCKPYCDPDDSTSPTSCELLCPNSYLTIYDTTGQLRGALCVPTG